MKTSLVNLNQMQLGNLYRWLGTSSAVTLVGPAETPISGITTDSRNMKPGALFVAIAGEAFDGHSFIPALQGSAGAVLIDRYIPDLQVPSLKVANTRDALADIAFGYRKQFDLPLIGVTGSNGKTTVKEMISAILAAHVGADSRIATAGNLNNDIGVPLTLFKLGAQHKMGVIEMGMNHPGEIAQLARMTQPQVVVVTNAQREHQEFMASVEATAHENGSAISALQADGVAVFPFDDSCAAIWRQLAGARRCFKFGLLDVAPAAANCDVVFAEKASQPQAFTLQWQPLQGELQKITIELHIDGVHNVRNALAAASCALAVNIPLQTIAAGLAQFVPVKGRLVRTLLNGGANLIDDSYNANPDSVRAAISVLAGSKSSTILVLGDMGEVGNKGPEFHAEVGCFAAEQGINHILLFGEATRVTAQAAGQCAQHFDSIDALIERLRLLISAQTSAQTTVLVKGSRFMKMERVVNALVEDRRAA